MYILEKFSLSAFGSFFLKWDRGNNPQKRYFSYPLTSKPYISLKLDNTFIFSSFIFDRKYYSFLFCSMTIHWHTVTFSQNINFPVCFRIAIPSYIFPFFTRWISGSKKSIENRFQSTNKCPYFDLGVEMIIFFHRSSKICTKFFGNNAAAFLIRLYS